MSWGRGPRRKTRLDALLVLRGLAPSREKAQALVMAGQVLVAGQVVDKPGKAVSEDAQVEVTGPQHPWVSRGGVKLSGALETFALQVDGFRCLDVGASTGGFTHVLLRRGAGEVVAVDVGKGQLHWSLRNDPRVKVVEGVNARYLQPEQVGANFDLVTVDLSFISLRLVLPALVPLVRPGGWLLCLVKPQFEAGKGEVGRRGVVKDETVRRKAIEGVAAFAQSLGLALQGRCPSPIPGPAGNLEEFLLLQKRPGENSGLHG